MASLAGLYVSLEARVSGYVTGMGAAAKATREVEAAAIKAGRTVASVEATIAAAAQRSAVATAALADAERRLELIRRFGAEHKAIPRLEREVATARNAAADAALRQAAADKVQAAGAKETVAAGTRVRNILMKVATVASVAVVAGMLASANAAIQLEKRLYNVATISDQVANDIPGYSAKLVAMSKTLPQSANQLAEGLYDIVSTGFQADDALVVLNASARAASAGMTDTATSAKAISAVLKAYGLGAESASDVSDVLFRTVDKGVITFEELSQQIGDFIGVGAAAKVPIDDLGSAIAAITLSGVPAAEAATSLNNLLSKMIKPSEALNQQYRKLGYESGAAALEQDGLYGVMEKLRGATGGNVTALLKLFPEIRAARGAFALMAADGKNYADTQASISDEVARYGATQDALMQQSKSTSYQMKELKNQVVALAISFGTALLPAIKNIVGFGSNFVDMLNSLPGPVKSVGAEVLTMVATIGLLGVGAVKAAGPLRSLAMNLRLLQASGSGAPAALTGLGKAVGIVAVAALAGAAIYGQYAEQKKKAAAATGELTDALVAETQGQAGAAQAGVLKQLSQANIGGASKAGSLLESLKKSGVDLGVVYKGLTGTAQDFQAAQDAMRSAPQRGELLLGGITQYKQLREQYTAATASATLQASATDAATASTKKATGPIGDLTALVMKDKNGTEQLTDAQDGLRSSLTALVDPAEAAKTALTSLTDPAKVFADLNSKLTDAATKARQDAQDAANDRGQATLQAAQDAATAASQKAADAPKGEKAAAKAESRAAAERVKLIERSNKARQKAYDNGKVDVTASLAQWTKSLQDAAKDQNTWEAELTKVAQKAGPDVANALRNMGDEAKPIIKEIADGTQTQADKIKAALGSLAPSARKSLGNYMIELNNQLTAQAKWAGSLATLAARGRSNLVEEFEKLAKTDPQSAAVLAAQAAKATGSKAGNRQLDQLGGIVDRRGNLDGGTLEQGLALLSSATVQNGKATPKDILDAFNGSLGDAVAALLTLKTSITDLPTQKRIQVLLDLVAPTNVIAVQPNSILGQQIQGSGLLINTGKPSTPNRSLGGKLNGLHSAHGNILEAYASGGVRESHVAQISRGTTRLWAEPETGGEAYIPLGADRRARSLNILSDVAQRFGMRVQPTAAASLVQGQPVRGYSQPVMRSQQAAGLTDTDLHKVALLASSLVGQTKHYEFSGPVNMTRFADIQRQADAHARLASITGGT